MIFDDAREDAPKLPTILLGSDAGAKLAQPPLARASSREAVAPLKAVTTTTYSGEVTNADPLKMLMGQKKADDQQASQALVKPVTRAEHLEAFMAHQLPRAATTASPSSSAPLVGLGEATAASALTSSDRASTATAARRQQVEGSGARATIQSRQDIDGVTWYSIRVWDGTGGCLYHKRYNDFKEFDSRMRAEGSVAAQILPELPSSGTLGLRHKFDVGDFNEKRQEGLQKWLDALTRNFKLSTAQEFFSQDRAQAPRVQRPQVASQSIHDEEDDGTIQWQ